MSSDEELVESLLLDWYTKRGSGIDVPLEVLCRDRPDLLPRLRARAAAVLRVESVNHRLGSQTMPDPGVAPPQPDRLFDISTVLEQRGGDELGWLGRFRVLRMLGCGGMGAVFVAEDTRNRRLVALKVMRPDRSDLPLTRNRFLREARAAAAVSHDNLMPVYEAAEVGGVPYLVMPLFGGETLADRLARGPLPVPEVVRLARHILLGLAAAHGVGIVHRDLKPSNVWLEALPDADGDVPWRARLMDFGLALDLREVERLTASGLRIGTPEYMSPEQADDREVLAQTDLFSLGVLLYESATGTHPFGRHTNLVVQLNAIVLRPAAPEPLLAAGVPALVAVLILRLLAKAPAARPATASAAVAELRAAERAGRG